MTTSTISDVLTVTAEHVQALWWAWHTPRLEARGAELTPFTQHKYRRARALLDAANDPLVTAAYRTIEAGSGAQAAAVASGSAIGDLLARVYTWAPGEHIDELQAGYKPLSPAAELFAGATGKEPVMVLEELDPGSGQWPQIPAHKGHDNETGTVITIRGDETSAAAMITPNWRETEKHPACPACQYKRTQRVAKQVLWELGRHGALWLMELPDEAEYIRFRDRARQRRHRHDEPAVYLALPTGGGRYAVIHNQEHEGGADIPHDRTELFWLLFDAAVSTPEKKLISSSVGWGGPWQGTRGDGRVKLAKQEGKDPRPVLQLWTEARLAAVAKALGEELKPRQKKIRVRMNAERAYLALAGAGLTLYEKDTNRAALEAVLEHMGVDVTHLAQESQEKTMCKKCDSESGDSAFHEPPVPLLQAVSGGLT